MKRAVWSQSERLRPILANLTLVMVYVCCVRINLPAASSGDIAILLLILQECCVIGLALVRRSARTSVQWDTSAAMLGWCGTLAPLLVRPADPAPLPWPILGSALQCLGDGLALSATLALGRSFGIVAANRGIQMSGLYQIVRHPLYAAYLLAFAGFVLARPSVINAVVLLVWAGFQIARVQAEERLLRADPRYQAYAARVRYRLIPRIW